MTRAEKLHKLQALSLFEKIYYSKQKIKEFMLFTENSSYIAFSGGKDSTVLLHLVRSIYPDMPAIFCDTGLEFPEIKSFVKKQENITTIKPKMHFREVITRYGYPVVSKEVAKYIYEIRNYKTEKTQKNRLGKGNFSLPQKWRYLLDAPFPISDKCCDVMKKKPFQSYEKQTGRMPIVGTMVIEGSMRLQSWFKYGCNYFSENRAISKPLSIWGDKDIWEYIENYKLDYASCYDTGEKRTGCVYCLFGAGFENPNRIQRLYKRHPKMWNYAMDKLDYETVMLWVGLQTKPIQYELFSKKCQH